MSGEEVSIEELEEARQAGVLLVDVRQPEEYEAGHVPGARLIPMGDVVARAGELPHDQPVYVICHTGVRSLKAARFYRSRGIDAWSVAGGTKDWAESGRRVVVGSEEG